MALSVWVQILWLDNLRPAGSSHTLGLQRSIRSGLGLPTAFFNEPVFGQLADGELFGGESLPVMVKAAPTESIRPRTPQFSSHSLSFMRYLPVSFLLPEGIS